MPQFDKIAYFTQVFWVLVTFLGFYFFVYGEFLPKIAKALKVKTRAIKAVKG